MMTRMERAMAACAFRQADLPHARMAYPIRTRACGPADNRIGWGCLRVAGPVRAHPWRAMVIVSGFPTMAGPG